MLDSLMHDDLVKTLTRRWQVSILCMGRQAQGLSKTRSAAVCASASLSRRHAEVLAQENALKSAGKNKDKATEKNFHELSYR